MLDVSLAATDRQQALRELLLGYLLSAGLPDWPGADGQTVHEVLLTYSARCRGPSTRSSAIWWCGIPI